MTSPRDAVDTDNGRYYERHGKRYISVTNVIERLSKPALVPWAVKLTAEAAIEAVNNGLIVPGQFVDSQRPRKKKGVESPPGPWDWKNRHNVVKDESADKGSLIHAWAEGWVLGQEPDPPQGLELECVGIMRAFEKYGIEPIAAESTVYNNMHDYAGTCDLFGTVNAPDIVAKFGDGKLWVLDYKTGKNVWPETAMQLAAYRYAEFIGLPDDSDVAVPAADHAGVLHVGHAETILVPYKAGVREFTAFLGLLQVARWNIEVGKEVMGEPL